MEYIFIFFANKGGDIPPVVLSGGGGSRPPRTHPHPPPPRFDKADSPFPNNSSWRLQVSKCRSKLS